MEIKCPICENNEFIKMDAPINDQYARLNGECMVCIHCGYVVWFNTSYVQFYNDRKETIKGIDIKIKEIDNLILSLEKDINNVDLYKKNLVEYKEELAQRIKWGEGGSKKCRSLEESIDQLEDIIKGGINRDIELKINNLKSQLRGLKEEREKYYRPIQIHHEI